MYNYKQQIVKSETEEVIVAPREIDFIGEVDEQNTRHLIDFLCMCEAQDKKIIQENANKTPNAQTPLEPIRINITSPGGCVDLGLAIVDKMESMIAPIHTHVNGCAYSMGLILYLMGEIRTAGRFARFMNHGSSGYTWGYLPESKAILNNHEVQDALCDTIVLNKCGYPKEQLNEDKLKCHFFGYVEALDYGIVNKDNYSLTPTPETEVTDADEMFTTDEITKVEHKDEPVDIEDIEEDEATEYETDF